MEEYIALEIEVIVLESRDVITDSRNEFPNMPYTE